MEHRYDLVKIVSTLKAIPKRIDSAHMPHKHFDSLHSQNSFLQANDRQKLEKGQTFSTLETRRLCSRIPSTEKFAFLNIRAKKEYS